MKTNKIYKDALTLSYTQGSDNAMQNKWLKIEMTTEDPQLKYFANALRRLYSHLLPKSSITYRNAIIFEGVEIWGNRQTYPLLNQKLTQLREYLEPIIASEKPQWQIIAMQHGWTPPPSNR